MSKALVVVDMQNDFLLESGSLNLGHDTKTLRENVAALVASFDGPVYLTFDKHKEDDCEFAVFPVHCVEHTEGHKLAEEIKAVLKGKNFHSVGKKSYTGGGVTNMANEFYDNDIKEIHVVGVCTHICVHDVVANIVNHTKNQYNYIPKVIVHQNLVDDFDADMAAFALKRMVNLYSVELV